MTATPDQVIAQIREALEGVTIEAWCQHRTVVEFQQKRGGFDLRDCPESREKAAYIAAVNPQNIAILLTEIDALRNCLTRLCDYENAEYVPNVLFSNARSLLSGDKS